MSLPFTSTTSVSTLDQMVRVVDSDEEVWIRLARISTDLAAKAALTANVTELVMTMFRLRASVILLISS